MLEEKTKGNLTAPEANFLTNTLYELRMGYVRTISRQETAAQQEGQTEETEEEVSTENDQLKIRLNRRLSNHRNKRSRHTSLDTVDFYRSSIEPNTEASSISHGMIQTLLSNAVSKSSIRINFWHLLSRKKQRSGIPPKSKYLGFLPED